MKRGKKKSASFFDIQTPHRLARRPLAYHLPSTVWLTRAFQRALRGHPRLISGLLIVAIVGSAFGIGSTSLFANMRTLAPVACSGDWKESQAIIENTTEGIEGAYPTEAGQKVFCSFPTPSTQAVPLTRAVLAFSFTDQHISSASEEVAEDTMSEEEDTADEEPEPEGDVAGVIDEAPQEELSEDTAPVLSEETTPFEEETVVEEVPEVIEDETSEEITPPIEESGSEAESHEGEGEPSALQTHQKEGTIFSWLFGTAVAYAQEGVEQAEAPSEESAQEDAEDVPEEEIEVEEIVAEEAPEGDMPQSVIEDQVTQTDLSDEETEHVAETMNEPSSEEVIVEDETNFEEEGEVLGEQTEESAGVEETASLLTLSYTLNGARWVDLTTFTPKKGEVTFDIDLTSTADLEKLVVRLTADRIGAEPIILSEVEVRMYTDAPFEELLKELTPPPTGVHVYSKEFVIDPKAQHSCRITPGVLDATETPSLVFSATLLTEDQEEVALETEDSASEDDIENEGVPGEDMIVVGEEEVAEDSEHQQEAPGEVSEVSEESFEPQPILEEEEAIHPPSEGVLAQIVSAGEELVGAVVESVQDVLDGEVGEPLAILEVGSLPQGIDVRFLETGNYAVTFESGVPSEVPMALTVANTDLAQKGSFSVPIIFTWKKGKDSIAVCQMNIVNKESYE